MKRKMMVSSILVVLLLFSFSTIVRADIKPRSTGIGFRGTYWRSNNARPQIFVTDGFAHTEIDVGGGGGWIYFFSRVDNDWIFEFSIGAIGEAAVKESYDYGEDVEVNAIIPILFGLRHDLFSFRSRSALQPYLAFGAGPYCLSEINVKERYFEQEEEVSVKTRVKPGGYAGGGMNFMFSSWFGLNFDIKYHFVDFNVNHDYSGWEYGFGFFFTWGSYRPSR